MAKRLTGRVGEELLRVVEGLHAVHVIVVDAREVGTDRHTSCRHERLVEPEPERAVEIDRVHLDLARVEVDRGDLVPHADVDAVPIAERLRCAGDELLEVLDLTADEIRDAARRVRGVVPSLERHDLHVRARLAHLRDGGHAAGVSADHNQPFGHRAQDRGANMA